MQYRIGVLCPWADAHPRQTDRRLSKRRGKRRGHFSNRYPVNPVEVCESADVFAIYNQAFFRKINCCNVRSLKSRKDQHTGGMTHTKQSRGDRTTTQAHAGDRRQSGVFRRLQVFGFEDLPGHPIKYSESTAVGEIDEAPGMWRGDLLECLCRVFRKEDPSGCALYGECCAAPASVCQTRVRLMDEGSERPSQKHTVTDDNKLSQGMIGRSQRFKCNRSEERRVGKECRTWRSTDNNKEKVKETN